ncbi:hypothetical protein OG195_44695 (plasmid) [Streptomyces sp. NBC_01362]|uniref:hypothetical protein n=1 Tax=Streptomyces sp. NBC_01362 TaxID=2903839 RepID=UPI002E31640A|nr:hypothetical protein [Streptomyces sp. NBC_01362]
MDTELCEVRTAGRAVYVDSSAAHSSRMPVSCGVCDARTGLTLAARGEDAWITCPDGHTTRDWRLTGEAVSEVAAAAAEAGVGEVPVDAEIWVRVRPRTGARPDREDI